MSYSLPELIQAGGLLGISLIVFAESGLFFAFFLPGDSLLFTAGILAAAGTFSLLHVILVVFIGAWLGNLFGYLFGKKVADTLFTRKDTFFFKKAHLTKTHQFYEKYGSITIILARFVPIVRTFAPILAGASHMTYKKFLFGNSLGALAWSLGMPLLGYFLGSKIPHVDAYILPVIGGIMIASFIPFVYKFIHGKFTR